MLYRSDCHVVVLKCPIVSPERPRLSAPSSFESHNILVYLMIQPDVAAEAGTGRDEAKPCKHESTQKLSKLC